MSETFVTPIQSVEEFAALEAQALQKNLVLFAKFSAEWCRPCHQIAPHYEALAQENQTKGLFLHIDIEELPDLTERFKITAMPTFKVLKCVEGTMQVVDELKGANKVGLDALIETHCSM